jgi:hypothetical protein
MVVRPSPLHLLAVPGSRWSFPHHPHADMASAGPSAERGLIERAEPVPGTEMPIVSCFRIQHRFPNSLGAAERVIPQPRDIWEGETLQPWHLVEMTLAGQG